MRTQTAHERGGGDEVARWQCEQLVDSGFPTPVAARLAADSSFDLHELIGLVEHGCPPELAVQILAPLEPQDRA